MALYIGKNKVIHAANSNQKVIAESLKDLLKKRDFVVAKRIIGIEEEKLIVTIPSWREDLKIKEDLVEEVGRIYDYNKMNPTYIYGELKPELLSKNLSKELKIKEILSSLGFDEVYNYSFYKAEGKDSDKHFKVINPLNPDQEFLRITLRPKIEENLEKNIRLFDEVKIFEIGNVFLLPHKEEKRIIVALALKDGSGKEIFKNLKGILENLFEKLNISEKVEYQKDKNILIKIGKDIIGDFKIEMGSGSFELSFDKLIKFSQEKTTFKGISIFPPIRRDLAIVVEKNVPFDSLLAVMTQSSLIQKTELFDEFENEKIGKGKKSLAFRLVFQSFDRTLRAEEVEREIKKILDKLGKELGAKLRDV